MRVLGRMIFSVAGISLTDAGLQVLESMREMEGREANIAAHRAHMVDASDSTSINTPSVAHVA